MKHFSMNRRGSFTAAEILSSAFCPLDCKYCYVPKTNSMKSLHKEIIRSLEDNSYIKTLEKVYGNNLKYLSFWGAEPTVSFEKIGRIIPQIFIKFSKLKSLNFSTSLMTNPNYILNFINLLINQNKKLQLNIQISLDGPAFITDINRIKGASKKVPENFCWIIKELNKTKFTNLNIRFRIKSTFTINNIRMLNRSPGLIKEYFKYFDKIEKDFKKLNKNKEITFTNSCAPTLSLPGEYTSEDGKELAVLFKYLRKRNCPNVYYLRMKKVFGSKDMLFVKPHMFTCSGGRNNIGLGIKGDLHICHRSFFLNNKEHLDSILKQNKAENWEINLFEQDKAKLIANNFIIDIDDEKGKIRWQYVMRNYHDFTRLKNNYTIAMLKELALCGQANKQYLVDSNLCRLFAIFVNTAVSCPEAHLLNTGCVYFLPVSLIRIFANGVFLGFLKQFLKDEI